MLIVSQQITMEQYTLAQRLQIIQIYYQNSRSIVATLRGLRPIFGQKNLPTRSTVERLVRKFESTYSLHNVPVPVRQRSVRSAENIDAVRESLRTDPTLSVACRAQKLGIPQSSLRRILQNDLNLHAVTVTNMKSIGENQNDQKHQNNDDDKALDADWIELNWIKIKMAFYVN